MARARDRAFWVEVVVGLAPATFLIAPRLLRWTALFAFGVRVRVLEAAASPNPFAFPPALLRSAYFLSWAITALVGILALWPAVLMRPDRLRSGRLLRWLVLAGLTGGLFAAGQYLVTPLAGLDPGRSPLVGVVLAGPVAVSVVAAWRLLRARSTRG